MDQGYKGTVDLKKVDDEIKRLNVENQYIRSTLDILRKNIIIRDEKPRMEIKPPDILIDDQELIDLTTSVTKASEKFYSLEMELDNVYRKISQLSTMVTGIERNNDAVASKKNNVEATARKPRNSQGQMTDQSPECLKLEKDLELIASTWMTMKEKERSHTTSQDCEQSKSAATEGGDVDSLKDFQVLKDKISGLEILLAALEEYITSDKQNSSLDVPSELQSGQKCVVEYAQTKRIAQKFEKMKSALETLREEINSIQAVRSKLRQQVKILKHEVKHLKDDLEKKAQAAKEQEDERAKYFDEKLQVCIKELEVKSKKLETQAKEMEELRKAKDDILTSAQETLREEINSIQAVRSKLRRQVKTLKYEVKHLKDELEKKSQAAKEQEDELQVCIKELEVKSKKLETQAKEMEELRNARDDALTRPSRLMGQKMSDGNPNITDLSDRYRPSKLGEIYSELYDNQWTDAFEALTETFYLDDKSAIELLLKILRVSPDCKRLLREARKLVDIKKSDDFLKDFQEELAFLERRYLREEKVICYINSCFQLCWLMSIQEPPVVLSSDSLRGDQFDTNLYKHYMQSGDKVNYIVWPALLLHKDGPLLAKGVAEPCTILRVKTPNVRPEENYSSFGRRSPIEYDGKKQASTYKSDRMHRTPYRYEVSYSPEPGYSKTRTQTFSPESDYSKTRTQTFSPESDYSKTQTQKFSPESDYSRTLMQKHPTNESKVGVHSATSTVANEIPKSQST